MPLLLASAGVLAAKVWHYWISVALIAGTLLTLLMLGIGYIVKVLSLKYPRQ